MSVPRVAFITSCLLPTQVSLLNCLAGLGAVQIDVLLSSLQREGLPERGSLRTSILENLFPRLNLSLLEGYQVSPGLVKWLTDTRYDCFLIGGYSKFWAHAALGVAACRRTPYILYCESHNHAKRGLFKRCVKSALLAPVVRAAAAHVAVSSWAKEYLVQHGAKTVDVFVVPYLPDEPLSGTSAGPSGPSTLTANGAKPPVVLWVGRMVPAKGLDVLLEALRMLPAGVEWKLVLVGEGGERRRLEFLARDYGLKQQVAFMGPATRQQLSLFYSTADVFVFPSNEEPFGAVIPEAMAHGVPIVSTNVVGATADFVIDGHNGFVVSPKDPHALAAALATILSDSTLRRRMGENSRAIMGRHNVQQNATILLEAIRHGLRMQPKAVL